MQINFKNMKFEQTIKVKGRIDETQFHEFTKVSEQGGYMHGDCCNYYTHYLYKNDKETYFSIYIHIDSPEEKGDHITDWLIIPADISNFIKKDVTVDDERERIILKENQWAFNIAENTIFDEDFGWHDDSSGSIVGWIKNYQKKDHQTKIIDYFTIAVSRKYTDHGGYYKVSRMKEGYKFNKDYKDYLIDDKEGSISFNQLVEVIDILDSNNDWVIK
jgi:hypothetical protein